VELAEPRATIGHGHGAILNERHLARLSPPMRPLAIALVLAALAGPAGSSGAAPTPLLIASEGLPAPVAAGAARYFAWISSRGGLNGRRIAFRAATSADEPIAVLTPAGTAEEVPQLVVGAGAAGRRRAWTVGYVPGYGLEARVIARQIAKTSPGSRIAVLYSNDPDGRELLARFEHAASVAIASTDVAIVRASGADTLVVLSSHPLALPQRDWLIFSNAAAAEPFPGAVSTVFVRTPGDPAWIGDPTQRRFRPANAGQALGLAAAFTLVDALRRTGKTPTRATLLTALRRSAEANNPFLVPGIVVRNGIRQVALQRWSRGRWGIFTPPVAR
jgi:branched-chain amino acid transport system substrate-binding protein